MLVKRKLCSFASFSNIHNPSIQVFQVNRNFHSFHAPYGIHTTAPKRREIVAKSFLSKTFIHFDLVHVLAVCSSFTQHNMFIVSDCVLSCIVNCFLKDIYIAHLTLHCSFYLIHFLSCHLFINSNQKKTSQIYNCNLRNETMFIVDASWLAFYFKQPNYLEEF